MRWTATILILLAAVFPPAAQAQSDMLTVAVYPGATEQLWDSLVEAFSDATGVKARIFAPPLPAASVAQAAGHPSFDAALVASYAAPGLMNQGLLEPLTPDSLPAIHDVPEAYWPRSPDKSLMGAPIYFSIYGIAYNTDLASASDFQSWNGLLDPKWQGQIPLNRPTMLAAYDLTLFAKLNGGDSANVEPGYAFIQKLAAHAHSVYSSMSTFESELARGEVTAAPFYSAEIALQKRLGAPTLGFTVPKEGGLMLSYLLVVPKGAAHSAEAEKFMNWVMEPQAQLKLAADAGVWPMNSHFVLPPALATELGGNVTDVMAHNYYPDWYAVGTALPERTHHIEELIQKIK
jgi:putative spermidine/putrescine transport system substrate-binding protein